MVYLCVVLLVYLRASPEVCYERLRRRNRKEENTVPYVSTKEELYKYCLPNSLPLDLSSDDLLSS